jgi:integrase
VGLSAKDAKFRVSNKTIGDSINLYSEKYLYNDDESNSQIRLLHFASCIERAAESEFLRAKRGEITLQTANVFASRCDEYLRPTLGPLQAAELTHGNLIQLLDDLTCKGLCTATVRQILMCAKKVMNWALLHGVIDRLPVFPTVRTQSTPRGGFTPTEYRTLWKATKMLSCEHGEFETQPSKRERQGGLYSKKRPVPGEMRWLIAFMVNSFVRPSDIKNLQHRHVEIVRGHHTYLRLNPPESKRHSETIITLRPAVRIYESLRDHQRQRGYGSEEDYLFYPEVVDRKKAMMAMDHHFRRVLEHSGLREGKRGQTRTLYSLRHTALTYRLIYGKGIDLLTLAKNARTSVEMIERFYASELNPEMNVAMLHSRRTMARELPHPWT